MADKRPWHPASKRDTVSPDEFVTAEVDVVMGHDRSFWSGHMLMTRNGFDRVRYPDRIVVIIDHAVPALNFRVATVHRQIREWVKFQNISNFYDCGEGICHQILPEKGHALPGSLIVGGDSHTTTYGALGAASCGIGVSDLAYVMAKGNLWFMVPGTIRFELNGILPKGVSAKDIILKIAGDHTAEVAQYRAVEFGGPAASALSMAGRLTMSNMGVEIGAKFAFFETDEKTEAFLKGSTSEPFKHFGPDPDAAYFEKHKLDVSDLEPQVACPHNVDNVKPVSRMENVIVNQAFIGSCTNARVEDLERAAAIYIPVSLQITTEFIPYIDELMYMKASMISENENLAKSILNALIFAYIIILTH